MGKIKVERQPVSGHTWITPVCAVFSMRCSWAVHFASRRTFRRHCVLCRTSRSSWKWTAAITERDVAYTFSAVSCSQRGLAFALDCKQRLRAQLAGANLRIHEARDECEGLELFGVQFRLARGASHTEADLEIAPGDRGVVAEEPCLRSATLDVHWPLYLHLSASMPMSHRLSVATVGTDTPRTSCRGGSVADGLCAAPP